MFCTQCGKQLKEQQRFCTNCGSRLKRDAVAPAPEFSGPAAVASVKPPKVVGGLEESGKTPRPRKEIGLRLMWGGIGAVVVVIAVGAIFFLRPSSKQPAVPDGEIEKSILAKFAADPGLSKCTLGVKSENGVVTLSGLVMNVSDRSTAIHIILEQPGVKTVVDNLVLTTTTAEQSPTGKVQAEAGSNSPNQSASVKTLTIIGNRPWTDSGVDLSLGEAVMVSASGNVRFSAEIPSVGPGGDQPNCGLNANPRVPYVAKELPCHSLIGRVGVSGTIFEVGSSLRFRAPAAGRLYLGVNDNFFPDNSGSWTAIVSAPASVSDLASTPPRAQVEPAQPSHPVSTSPPPRARDTSQITSVSPISPKAWQTIVIKGTHFGTNPPFNGCADFVRITDMTANRAFPSLGPWGGCANPILVTSWTDSEIVIEGLPAFQRGQDAFTVGDTLKIEVRNPQQNWAPMAWVSFRVTPGSEN